MTPIRLSEISNQILSDKLCFYIVSECHPQYNVTEAIFEDKQDAIDYASSQQKLANDCKVPVQYRIQEIPFIPKGNG